jgi:phospholipase/carboxylesterase
VADGLGPHFVHLLPRAPERYEAGWAWYINGPDRQAHIDQARSRLVELVAAVRRSFDVGPEKIGVWGFSQGGVLALELGLFALSPLAAVVSVGGKLLGSTAESEATLARARGRDFLLVHGMNDPLVPHELSRQAYGALVRHGARAELAELPMGHEISPVAQAGMRGFFESCLGQSRRAPPLPH